MRRPALLSFAILATSAPARAEDALLEVGPAESFAKRYASAGAVSYGAQLGTGAFLRGIAHPHLRVSLRYLRAYGDVHIEPGNTPAPGRTFKLGSMRTETLGAYAHPTFSPLPRLHAWGTVGIGWNVMLLPAIEVDPPGGLQLRPRRGVFQEVPLGLGGSYDVIPHWLSVSIDWMAALPYSRTGDMFERDRYYDKAGKPAEATPLPKPTWSQYVLLSVGVLL